MPKTIFMKRKIPFLTSLCLLPLTMNAQIITGEGVVELGACDFEEDCAIIEMGAGESDLWQVGTPSKTYFETAYSPPNCIVTDTALTYGINEHDYFDVIITDDGDMMYNAGIYFWHKYQSDSLIDGGYIEFSYDHGETWNNLSEHSTLHPEVDFLTENLYGETDTLIGGINGYSGTSDDWVRTDLQWIWVYPIREVIPDTLLLRFNFMSDDVETAKDGWMIDQIVTYKVNMSGLAEEKQQTALRVFPNPANVSTRIEWKNKGNEQHDLFVFNILGEIVLQGLDLNGDQVQVDLSQLPGGIYQIALFEDDKPIAFEKLIVN